MAPLYLKLFYRNSLLGLGSARFVSVFLRLSIIWQAFIKINLLLNYHLLNWQVVCNAKESASLDHFRAICMETTSGHCDRILVCCYDRYSLDQIGTGHFTPIGGYHPERDLVLVFDVSRYKYPLHWLPLESLWKSMKEIDPATGKTNWNWACDLTIKLHDSCSIYYYF